MKGVTVIVFLTFVIFVFARHNLTKVNGPSHRSSERRIETWANRFENRELKFENFKHKYRRNYKNKTEEYARKLQHLKCLEVVKKHNEKYAAGNVTFRLKENKHCDRFESERKRFSTGNRLPPFDFSKFSVRGKSVGTVTNTMFPRSPRSFSWVDKAPHCLGVVKDQGYYCNNCWAFSGIAALEFHWCLKTNNSINLSEQQLIDCNLNALTGNWGCKGGSQAAAYMYIRGNNGIQTTQTYPYQEDLPHNDIFPCRNINALNAATANGYFRIRPLNETLLQDVIASKGPVSAALYGSLESFYFYSEGIYDDPACPIGNTHSVLIVGYGVENGIEYWLCKNSWSADWGMKGYFKIRKGVNRCGITSYLIYPTV